MIHRSLLVLSLGLAVAGCTSSPSAPATTPTATTLNLVHAQQIGGDTNQFSPASLRVKSGASVTWDVVGAGHHTVTFATDPNGGASRLDSGDLDSDQTFNVTFHSPGTFAFYCRYHSDGTHGMTGTITVT